jgi:glycerophosphoryl diester phosphodiesterase
MLYLGFFYVTFVKKSINAKIVIVGARGYERRIPLLVFKSNWSTGRLIELDVHLSADGELMVIHDETVDRTTNGKGCNFSVLELKQFKMEKNSVSPLYPKY